MYMSSEQDARAGGRPSPGEGLVLEWLAQVAE